MTRTARATLTLVAANLAAYFVLLAGWLLRDYYPGLPARMTTILSLPSSPAMLPEYPWTLLTYMFIHLNFVHLTVNMLWLIGFGPMMKGGWLNTAGTYVAGGICGAATFLAFSFAEGGHAGELAGASAAVISIVVATACLSPDRKLRMLFIGDVRLKWVALVAIVTMLAGNPSLSPVTAAHSGGALAGGIIGLALRRHYHVISRNAMEQARRRTRRLSLIHKAGQSGFASLSEPERLELFDLQDRH